MKQERRQKLFVLVFLFFFLFPISSSPKRKSSYKAMRQKLQSIEHQKKETKEKLRFLKKQEKKISEEIRTIDERLAQTEARYESLRRELARARMQREYYTEMFQAAREKLNRKKELFAQRLVEVYKYGRVQPLAVLASLDTMWDLLSRSYYLGRIMEKDAQLIQEVQEQALLLANEKRKKEEKERAVYRLTLETKEVQRNLSQIQSDKKAFQQKISKDRAYHERMLAELEATSQEIEAWLRAYRPHYTGQTYWTGKWYRPVSGYITSGFGMRKHPILGYVRLHTGIDISARYGTPVHAAGAGQVIRTGWWGGYGNVVILAHSSAVTTLYAHLSSISVYPGQVVSAGQVIGHVGCTGLCTGPHLHFEVRHYGRPVNPL